MPASYQPQFRYYTIGAYADRDLAEMNARLNTELSAEVTEMWY